MEKEAEIYEENPQKKTWLDKKIARVLSSRFANYCYILFFDILLGLIATLASLFFCSINTFFPIFQEEAIFRTYMIAGIVAVISMTVTTLSFASHKQVFRFAQYSISPRTFFFVVTSTVLITLGNMGSSFYTWKTYSTSSWIGTFLSMHLDFSLYLFTLFLLSIVVYRAFIIFTIRRNNATVYEYRKSRRIAIFGTQGESASAASFLENNPFYQVVGFITTEKKQSAHTISGKKIHYVKDEAGLLNFVQRSRVDAIIFPRKRDFLNDNKNYITLCNSRRIETLLLSPPTPSTPQTVASAGIRNIHIEDLLKREPIELDCSKVKDMYRDKVVLVTGAAGSIGSEIARQLAHFQTKHLIVLDNAETGIHDLKAELSSLQEELALEGIELKFTAVIGDVRSLDRIDYIFNQYRPQIVLHAAAYKHVSHMENYPCESVLTNVMGTKIVIDNCLKYNIEKMVMISTDKAVNPTNVMGACKRVAEMYAQSIGKAIEQGKIEGKKTIFVTTRFGNVLGSNGSVLHTFRKQIAKGGPVTVTDPEIRRFFMSIPEACSLVLQASELGNDTKIYVFDMGKPIVIYDLAKDLIRMSGFTPEVDIKIEIIGKFPGEKTYEEVLADAEGSIPTNIEKIKIANVREEDYTEIHNAVDLLIEKAKALHDKNCVLQLKKMIPEFKSDASSQWAALDQLPKETE